ncbi:keratin, type II cytoskeletal 68 kDa, component IB-like [Rhipicephalus sanguineus]|uniref:keratin, type II cytoskeletal 68 kDa, component IB-like n=1 Tax=Rhipicephalus sanguineus TaxID=34632 RepID=UPI001893BBEF|nr:keratin, type II cytoskeletal 68 kDa, component IB-like [Rhipicephalus sanguineus]XP_037529330.1 keratin, type II cytoskeletal 68 kDa, component IB-like [Rhipicephalus sanguineus]XP_037529336.1 keratin, type II cytoskeletal 68 kDa, component IB-like [Rhipicephalus sanguineus]XP_037529343.1 keratin, type II cytoskeletal 68 kDa, component IB-like [Rhipicephalus sanguineus]
MNALVVAALFACVALSYGQFEFGGGFDGGAGAGGFDSSSFGSPDGGAQLGGGDFSGSFGGGDADGAAAGAGFDTSGFTGGFEGFNAAAASNSRPQFGGFQSQFQGSLPQAGAAQSSVEAQ